MSDVTVKQLAESVGAPVDRLLKQMNEAGLPHTSEGEPVSEDEKQTLLTFLKRRVHGFRAEEDYAQAPVCGHAQVRPGPFRA